MDRPYVDRDDLNAETIAAMEEIKQMKTNPYLGKTYTDVDQMMEELLTEVSCLTRTNTQ